MTMLQALVTLTGSSGVSGVTSHRSCTAVVAVVADSASSTVYGLVVLCSLVNFALVLIEVIRV
jgi:hypothetical protein